MGDNALRRLRPPCCIQGDNLRGSPCRAVPSLFCITKPSRAAQAELSALHYSHAAHLPRPICAILLSHRPTPREWDNGTAKPVRFLPGQIAIDHNLGGRLVQISMGCVNEVGIYIPGTKSSIDSRSVLWHYTATPNDHFISYSSGRLLPRLVIPDSQGKA